MGSSMKIEVIFNGMPREIEMSKVAYVRTLMDRARCIFQPPATLKHLAFFTADGRELVTDQTLASSRVRDGDSLLLRPTVVR